MSDVQITISLPEELVERAQTQGLKLDTEHISAMIERELSRMQAANFLTDVARQLEGSLTPEEIEEELAAAKAERIQQANNRTNRR